MLGIKMKTHIVGCGTNWETSSKRVRSFCIGKQRCIAQGRLDGKFICKYNILKSGIWIAEISFPIFCSDLKYIFTRREK